MRMYAGGNGLSDGRGKSVKSIQEEDVGSEWIDGTIRRILAAQVFITVLFFLLLPAAGWCTVVWRYLWHSGMHHSIQDSSGCPAV
ncbi:MAG: hypothetical protein ACLVAW_29715 [Eisenbergiella massiliensis]